MRQHVRITSVSIHPRIVRATHWINAVAMVVMIMSGLAIHNAHPILPTVVPATLTLGGWLGVSAQRGASTDWPCSVMRMA